MWLVVLLCASFLLSTPISPVWAGASLFPDSAPPGATLTISGEGFGEFTSTQHNRVLFKGHPALIQRWERDLIEVKVPLRVKTGPVEVHVGKKRIPVGTFTLLQPAIQELVPAQLEAGAILQVTGRHFGNTAGSRDPNTMFGVNDVLINGVPAKIRRWRDDKIEVQVPANATSGDVVVRLASSDPLPDGSCCAPVEYSISNVVPLNIIPTIRVDPPQGPVGTKVVLFGEGFGGAKGPQDGVYLNGQLTTVAKWTDKVIVVHVPLGATSGPLVLKRQGKERNLGAFDVFTPKATGLEPKRGPIGSLVRITGENFGYYSESGSTQFSFIDFNKGENGVEIGGVPAIIYRWHEDRIDVWVPASAKGGPVVVVRGGTLPKEDGTCCAKRGVVTTTAGEFTLVTPKVESFTPTSAGLDEIVTIKGSGFGDFLMTMEATQPGLNEGGHDSLPIKLGQNVARSEVLFNGVAGVVVSWTDTEIKAQVPRRHVFGFGVQEKFLPNPTTGPLVVRRGSWDLLPDGSCCTPKQWVSVEAGSFTILPSGLPDQTYYTDPNPRRD